MTPNVLKWGGRVLIGLVIMIAAVVIALVYKEVQTTWYLDWPYLAEMLNGVGTLLVGIGALLAATLQWGYAKIARKNKELNKSLKDQNKKLEQMNKELEKKHKVLEQITEEKEELSIEIRKAFSKIYASSAGIVLTYPKDEDQLVKELSGKMLGFDEAVLKKILREAHENGTLIETVDQQGQAKVSAEYREGVKTGNFVIEGKSARLVVNPSQASVIRGSIGQALGSASTNIQGSAVSAAEGKASGSSNSTAQAEDGSKNLDE